MEKQDINYFEKELEDLVNKYEIKYCSFAGEHNEHMIGLMGIGQIKTPEDMTRVVMNTARLYQSAREKLFNYFNKMANSKRY